MGVYDKVMLRKRALIEKIFDQLKNISKIEHSSNVDKIPIKFLTM